VRRKNMKYTVGTMRPEDWEQVRLIYLEGIRTGNSTFEADVPEWGKWDSTHLPEPRLVIRSGDRVLAWAALSPVSSRQVYSGIAEISLYVSAEHRRQGIGSVLLKALIESSEKAGIWTLQGGIFPENIASLQLVKKCGFRQIGRREKVGKMAQGDLAGKWRDVLLVERRSRVAGID
jgi:L-amino acid N-acyltransferase YncA